MIILYVADQERSKIFYEAILEQTPSLHVPGMTEFFLLPGLKLGLMPENGIAKILEGNTPHPNSGNGIPRCELYIHKDNLQQAFQNALNAGAKEISKIKMRDWGDTVGYLTDPDGHIIAFYQSN